MDGKSSTVTWQLPHHDRLQGDQRVSNLDFANVICKAVSKIPRRPVLISVWILLAGMVNCNRAVDVTVVHLTLRRSYRVRLEGKWTLQVHWLPAIW